MKTLWFKSEFVAPILSGEMKALTIRQPWAEAILSLGKDVENRSWPTRYRGLLLIHAGAKRDDALCDALGLNPRVLTYGAIVGTVELVDCVRVANSKWAEPDQWHWVLRNAKRLDSPVICRGAQGLWNFGPESQHSFGF